MQQSGFICSAFVAPARARSGGRLYLQTRGSKFMKYQELKIQECVSVKMTFEKANILFPF